MALQRIEFPENLSRWPLSAESVALIDAGNDEIEAFMLEDTSVIKDFVNCDFHLVDQALSYINENHLCAGNRFCEWGSGFAIVTMLAALHAMESWGIEIDPRLVKRSTEFADSKQSSAKIIRSSFIPRGIEGLLDVASEVEHVETDEGDAYEEIGLAADEFDLFFAFPWPGEQGFFESVFENAASDGALLLTYRGREGMHLVRKI